MQGWLKVIDNRPHHHELSATGVVNGTCIHCYHVQMPWPVTPVLLGMELRFVYHLSPFRSHGDCCYWDFGSCHAFAHADADTPVPIVLNSTLQQFPQTDRPLAFLPHGQAAHQ